MKLSLSLLLLLLAPWAFANTADDDPPDPNKEQAKAGKKDPGKAQAGKKKSGKSGKSGDEESDEALKDDTNWGFEMGKHPTFTLGKWGTMSFRTKFQFDFKTFDPEQTTRKGCGILADSDGCLFELHSFRFSVKGRFLKDFDYEVERDFKQGMFEYFPNPIQDPFKEPRDPWRDVYVNYHKFKHFQIQGGKFKLPFGLESLQGDADKDFINQSRASDQLTPSRDVGIMLHGKFFKNALRYQAALFKNDGDGAAYKIILEDPNCSTSFLIQNSGKCLYPDGIDTLFLSATRTFAGNLTAQPLRWLPVPAIFKTMDIGVAFTDGALPPGRKGLRGRTTFGATWFDHMFVNGHRQRYSTSMNWSPGPFNLKAEFLAVNEQRLKQSLFGGDLPDLIERGWYVSGSYMITREHRSGFAPKRPFRYFLVKGGPGAIEVAVRLEALRFASAEHPGLPSRSFRAANILQNSDRAATFGVNWYLNHWIKIQANFIREHIEDPPRRPVVDPPNFLSGPDPTWTRSIRIQFAM